MGQDVVLERDIKNASFQKLLDEQPILELFCPEQQAQFVAFGCFLRGPPDDRVQPVLELHSESLLQHPGSVWIKSRRSL